MNYTFAQYRESADALQAKLGGFRPKVAMILGSGLGYLGDLVEDAVVVPYGEIPHFKHSTAPGHKGQLVFGRLAGEQAMQRAAQAGEANGAALDAQAADVKQRLKDLVNQEGNENWAKIRDEMGLSMEEGCGIYRTPELMQKTIDKLAELQERFKRVRITDNSSVFNTDLLYTIELGHGLNVAECMAHSAIARKESRGAHQRLDEGCTERDDVNFLKHTLAFREADGTTRLEYGDVKITTLPPAKRVYGAEADAAEKKETTHG